MGNFSCTQSQPEQTAPTEKDEPLMPEKKEEEEEGSSKHNNNNTKSTTVSTSPPNISKIPQNDSKSIAILYDYPNLNLYTLSTNSSPKLICTVAYVEDGQSYITDYTEQMRQCIDTSSNLPKFSGNTKYTFIDNKTNSKSICGLHCSDFLYNKNAGNYNYTGRLLIVTKALKIYFNIFSGNGGGFSSVGSMSNININDNSNNDNNINQDNNIDPPYLYIYENETLENGLCKYCDHFQTIPSGIEFVKPISGVGRGNNGSVRNILEVLDSFESIHKLDLNDGDRLFVRKNKKIDATLLSMRGLGPMGDSEYGTLGKGSDMKISVKMLSGSVIDINVKEYFMVLDCKYLVYKQKGINVQDQMLLFAGKQLENDESLDQCGVRNEAVLNLVIKTN